MSNTVPDFLFMKNDVYFVLFNFCYITSQAMYILCNCDLNFSTGMLIKRLRSANNLRRYCRGLKYLVHPNFFS